MPQEESRLSRACKLLTPASSDMPSLQSQLHYRVWELLAQESVAFSVALHHSGL